MRISRNIARPAAALALLLGGVAVAHAQSTDGYHTIQILPVVVDTASFTTRIVLNSTTEDSLFLRVRYVPATGTSQAEPIQCPEISLYAGWNRTYSSLRQLCPSLAAGSQFGYLYFTPYTPSADSDQTFAAYARVSNPQGIGFSVEAFPAHTFTSADTVVSGVRRLAATASSPAFQTNCFIGNLHDATPPDASVPTVVTFEVFDDFGVKGAGEVEVVPGKLVRLLDVFQAAAMPPGDFNDMRVRFTESGEGEPGLITFCTVQDNTSFGADFRIGKQADGQTSASALPSPAAQDDHVLRVSRVGADLPLSNGAGQAQRRPFSIPPGSTANTHLLAARHPDWVSCRLRNPATGNFGVVGLEMRLMGPDGITVLAGGNDTGSFGPLYLGDKTDQGLGANTFYTLEVESAEANTGVERPYELQCVSGSGHGPLPLLRTNGPNQF